MVGGLPRVLVETTGGQQTFFVYGQGLAYEVRPDGTRRYYHAEALGSTRVVTDDAGAVVSAFNYDAYGAVRQSAGEARSFTYTGENVDAETAFVFLRARSYDASTGRFLQKDSDPGKPADPRTLNRYGYAGANPLRYTDPSGHAIETVWDAANVAWDLYEVSQDPSPLNIAALVVDVGATFIPFVPGGAGLLVRGGKAASQAANHAGDIARAAERVAGGPAPCTLAAADSGSRSRVTLDLMGGRRSQIPGTINVDYRKDIAEGVRARTDALPFRTGSVDEILVSGPQAEFLPEAARVLKPGGEIFINATRGNKFGKLPTPEDLDRMGLQVKQLNGPLDPRFSNYEFRRTNDSPIPSESVRTTILERLP